MFAFVVTITLLLLLLHYYCYYHYTFRRNAIDCAGLRVCTVTGDDDGGAKDDYFSLSINTHMILSAAFYNQVPTSYGICIFVSLTLTVFSGHRPKWISFIHFVGIYPSVSSICRYRSRFNWINNYVMEKPRCQLKLSCPSLRFLVHSITPPLPPALHLFHARYPLLQYTSCLLYTAI